MKRFFKVWKRRHRNRGWARKGSSTMEYVIIIAVGALFAGLLYMTMSEREGLIQSALEKKVLEIIRGQLPEGDVPTGNTSGPDNPMGWNPGAGGSPDVGIPPELGGSNGSGATPGVPPVVNGTSPSAPGSGSGNPASGGNSSASSSIFRQNPESFAESGIRPFFQLTKLFPRVIVEMYNLLILWNFQGFLGYL